MAVKLYRQAARSGDADAHFNLGRCYLEGLGVEKHATLAAVHFLQAADKGDVDANLNLGKCYFNGLGVKKNATKAATHFKKAVDRGCTEAMVYLGRCYLQATSVWGNEPRAATLFKRAMDAGEEMARADLGYCYLKGVGVTQDVQMAVTLLKQAAEQGNISAIVNLSECYLKGTGVPLDFIRAAYYLKQASQAGDKQATQLLNTLYVRGLVTPQQIEQADAGTQQQKAAMPFDLFKSIKQNKPEKLATLIQADNINQHYGNKEVTPLIHAANKKKFAAAQELLQQGANVELTDRNYFTVYDNMDTEFALQLLAIRPRVRRERMEAIVNDCLKSYQPGLQHTKDNLIHINHALGLFIGVSNSALLTYQNKRVYLAHLLSMAGGDKNGVKEVLEGMTTKDVCTIKIFNYLQLFMQVHHGLLSFPDIGPDQLMRLLMREMYIATELHKWEDLFDYATYVPDASKPVIQQAVVTNLLDHMAQLEDGEEILFRTGYLNRDPETQLITSGHCIYVVFHRRGDELLVRIDNLWLDDIIDKHLRSGQKTHRHGNDKYYPYLAQVIPMNQLAELNDYVLGLLNARIEKAEVALPMIYSPYNQSQIAHYQFPDCGPQKVGNCPVENYYVGELYRLGRSILKQLCNEEKILLIKTLKINIPEQAEQIQRAQQLPLRGGSQTVSAPLPIAETLTIPEPLPSHEQLMQKMMVCLKISEQEVRKSSLVEQILVNLAGISSTLSNAQFQRESNGSTCFILPLTTDELIHFSKYYQENYPEFILDVAQESENQARIIVSTRCLFDQVVPAMGKQRNRCAIQ